MARIERLHALLCREPLRRKVLLASGHAAGHQWLEQVSRRYGPVLNTEVKTVASWALERCKLPLAKRGLRVVGSMETRWIVCRLLQAEAEAAGSYIAGVTVTPGLVGTFHAAIVELREAGVRAEALPVRAFEHARKGAFVRRLLAGYEAELARSRCVDQAGLMEIADDAAGSVQEIVIVDEHALRSAADRLLVEKLTGGRFELLSAEPGFTEDGAAFPYAETVFFHAAGELAEAREVVRRVLERGIPFDQAEVIASDYDRTAAILHCMAAALGIPCTFSDGLPIGVTRAGRAAHAYVEWVASGYRLDPLLAALRQGVIRLHDGGTGGGSAAPQGRTADDADPAAPSAVIRELERSGIGWGRERYALLAKLADRAEAGPGAAADRAAVLRLLQRVFARLFELLPEEAPAQPERFMRAVVDFVRTYAVVEGDGDVQVIAQLQELERSFKMASGIRMSGSLAVRYVREALDGLRVHVSAVPAPGRLHVASLEQGGQSGRPHTFILGMSEERWTASMRQDPVLLDEERARIGAELATSAARSRRRRQERNSRLGMIRGSCTVSCVTAALTDGQERMPAFEMLQLYRRKTGRADADFAELLRAMGDAVRYFRGMPGGGSAIGDRSGRLSGAALDAVDAWLQRLLSDGGQVKAGQDAVFERYPSLGDGHRAIQARMDINLSPYDGLVETDRHPLPLPGMSGDPAAAFSASRLEQYAGCPLQFFYQEVLGVRVKDAAEFDRSRWLDARRRGSLLHEIFNLYLIEMRDRRKHAHEPLPHDEERLQAIAEEAIRRFAEEVPAPSAHIFEKEADGIRRDVRMFAQSERQRTSVPVFTELPLHEDGEPFRLELGEELTLPIRGFVDRVDEIAPHKYKIYDYKTGNPRRYQPNETFAAGTQLQLPLYGAAVEQWMRRTGYDPEARVVASAYYFPTERGMGEEVARPQDRREDMAALLRTMLEAMAQGLYPPTAEAKNCLWCDYSAVCGSQAEQFAAKREAAGEGGRLGPIMEVSRYD